MGSKPHRKRKQSRARAHTRTAAAAQRERTAQLDEVKIAVKARYTDAFLLTAAAELGLDLHDRDELTASAAVGLTVLLWRNTTLEDAHAGAVDVDPDELTAVLGAAPGTDAEAAAALLRIRTAELDDVLPRLTGAADPAEVPRLDGLMSFARVGGGIPDDVMLRANASTASDVLDLLEEYLPDHLGSDAAGTDINFDPDGLPDYLQAVFELFNDPGRPVLVGPCELAADEFLAGDWDGYAEQLLRKLGTAIGFLDLIGARKTLWLLALSGASYASGWWPHPWYAEAVGRVRTQPEAPLAGDERFAHVGADEELWDTVATEPYLLNGAQAEWLVIAKFRGLVSAGRECRDARALRLGAQPGAMSFTPFEAIF